MFVLQFVLTFVIVASSSRAVPLLKNVGTTDVVETKPGRVYYKLPEDAIPYHYKIALRPKISPEENFTFTGASSIQIYVEKPISSIVLHAKNLTIDEKPRLWNGTEFLTSLEHTIDPVTDFLTVKFNETFSGNVTLALKYTGKLHDDLSGFYRSSYTNEAGKKVWLATTQFEPTYARRAFPCFDEPALKSTFEISINHDSRLIAVSNMPFDHIAKDEEDLRKQWTYFKITPVMSTYLIGFVVSDFDYVSSPDGKFRVWSKPNAVNTGHYALDIGVQALDILSKYTGIEHYSIIEKMDNFAIPQFRAGAMENWGIVTYRESALLVEKNVTTVAVRQSVATVIAHEFAHQWFGNLVSPLTWNYTWLNEGFANYFQHYVIDKINPDSRLMDQFVVTNLQATAFTADDKENQHPMNGNVNSPLEISAFFDSITYSKAGSVIRMISHVLGEKVFQTGLQAYLKKMEYSAANSNDLFESLAKASASPSAPVDLLKAFDSWASQRGYPVVHVFRDYKLNNAVVTQNRFLTNKTEEPKERWFVPINYATQTDLNFNDTKPSGWLTNDTTNSMTITELKSEDWIIVNKQQTGYYRVNYDIANWMLIANHLTSDKYNDINVLNRAQLLDDSFHLAQAGLISNHSIFLNLTNYLQQEIDYVPWTAAFRAFGTLDKALANTASHKSLMVYVLRLIEKLERTVGYDDTADDDVTMFNRISAIKWACYAGSNNCSKATHEKLVNHIVGSNKISTDLQNVALCAGIRAANATIWDRTFAYYRECKIAQERKAVLAALGCSTRPKELRTLLAASLIPGSSISVDDAIGVVGTGSTAGLDVVFDFISANFSKIVEINNGTDSIVVQLNGIGSRMTTEVQVDKLEKFIVANPGLATELKAKALASAVRNVEWVKKYEPAIMTFLKSQKLFPAEPTKESNSSGVALPGLGVLLLALVASVLSQIH